MKISYPNYKKIKLADDIIADKFIQTKTIQDIPNNILREIKLISLKGQPKGQPVGSYINRIATIYADVDIFQLIDKFKSYEDVGIKTALAMRKTVEMINKRKNHWFSELKAGLDKRYIFNIGYITNGNYYISDNLLSDSNALYNNNLISNEEIEEIRDICNKPNPKADDYDFLFNLFRSYYVLRWNIKEIREGVKILPGNIPYRLDQAIYDKTVVKIDMIVYLDRFIEVTNFMMISYVRDGQHIPINIGPEDYSLSDIPYEIEKFYYSDYYYNPFKLVKRAFSYLKWFKKHGNDQTDVDKYIVIYGEIIKKTINILYAISSELDAMEIIQNKIKPIRIRKRLNELKEPLSNVLELDENVLSLLVSYMESPDVDLAYLRKLMNDLVNFYTIIYFEEYDVNPPPSLILPKHMSYAPMIVREL